MKKIVLWGAGYWGDQFYKLCRDYSKGEYEVAYWCDKNLELRGKKKEGREILAPEDLKKVYETGGFDIIIPAVSLWSVREVTYQIKSLGLDVVYYISPYLRKRIDTLKKNVCLDDIMFPISTQKPVLDYFEFHICDHCNLNCKGCAHISNMAEPYFADLAAYEKDLKRLRELFSGCLMIKLLGGEPLLNPQLSEFVKVTRRYFPESDLRIGTNGLLIPRMDSKLAQTMREEGAYFFISAYEPALKMKDQIIRACEEAGVFCEFSEPIQVFSSKLCLERKNNRDEAFQLCRAGGVFCFTLREGRISPCTTFYMRKLNEIFHTDLEITEEDDFDIYEKDGWTLDRLLHAPIPFCEYCGIPREYKWEAGGNHKPCLSDYLGEVEEEHQ